MTLNFKLFIRLRFLGFSRLWAALSLHGGSLKNTLTDPLSVRKEVANETTNHQVIK